jgi:formate hydrogenlyase subunit 6/NADH:ubiquinone oxidoreductase subunit I
MCTICVDYCPTEAITNVDGISISTKKCVECGICSAQCPNDVFQVQSISDFHFYQQIFHTLEKDELISIECNGLKGQFETTKEKITNANAFYVPCFGCISEIPLLLVLSMGYSNFRIEECKDECNNYRGKAAFKNKLLMTEHLSKTLNLKEIENDTNSIIPVVYNTVNHLFVTRRRFMNKSLSLLINALIAATLGGNKDTAQPISQYSRRKLLTQLAERVGTLSHIVKKGELPFSDIVVENKKCTVCGICSRLCPTSALKMKETTDSFSLNFIFGLCTGCELCIESCPEKAVHSTDVIDLGYLSQPLKVLVQRRTSVCLNCHSKFIQDSSSKTCSNCRKRDLLVKFNP